MKDQDNKADKKKKKKKNDRPDTEKQLVRDITKQMRKELDSKMEEVMKRVRRETKRALKDVLEDAKRRIDADAERIVRESLQGALSDHSASLGELGVEEVTLNIEPDELHMGEDLQVVEVGDNSDEEAGEKPVSRKSQANAKTAKSGESPKNKNGSGATSSSSSKRRTAKPEKKGTAESEIGTDTGISSELDFEPTA